MHPVLQTAASLVVVSALPLLVAALLPRDPRRLHRIVAGLVSFAIGALLGGAFLHLIPEAYALARDERAVALAVLGGFLGFFLLERFIWHHGHAAPQRERRSLPPLAAINVVGDAVHNFMDGMAIAASFQAGTAVGLATSVAVVLHEVPQELGDYGVLLHSGLSVRRAVRYNLASATTAFLGGALVLVAGAAAGGTTTALLLPITAGSFIYIAARLRPPPRAAARPLAPRDARPARAHPPRHRGDATPRSRRLTTRVRRGAPAAVAWDGGTPDAVRPVFLWPRAVGARMV
jgi:zinc and cadmium transporter